MRDPIRQLLRHRPRARHDLLRVIADVLRRKTELVEIVQQVIDFGGAQQCHGRDAAPIQADPTEMLAFHQRGLHAELRRSDRRDITARPAADHNQVEGTLRHSVPRRMGALSIKARPRRKPGPISATARSADKWIAPWAGTIPVSAYLLKPSRRALMVAAPSFAIPRH